MEKNKAKQGKKRLGIVALVLLLILAIGATAGTTLAKYITSGDAVSNQATVAQWGYTFTAATGSLFGEKYDKTGAVTTDGTAVIVSAATGKNVVAPGAKGEATLFAINGTSEVDAQLIFDITEFQDVVLKISEGTDYLPLAWKLNDAQITLGDKKAFADAVAKIFTDKSLTATVAADGSKVTVNLPANTEAFKESGVSLKFSWEWAFGEEDANVSGNDANDTILGHIAAYNDAATYEDGKYAGTTTEVKIGFKATVVQVRGFEA